MTTPKDFTNSFPHVSAGDRIGVAVSGGSDSTALLLIAKEWADQHGAQIFAATVDHGLRPEAADEAEMVATLCRSLGVSHQILHWQDHPEAGNLQANAREGRYRLLRAWARDVGVSVVLIGHTQDDVAETVLMNLARGSGVDGLASINAAIPGDIPFLRPLLLIRRAALRAFLQARGVQWVDDPSNDDLRFDRVRARKMLAYLADLGLTPDRLSQTASHMQRAQRSLTAQAVALAEQHVMADGPDLIFDEAAMMIERSDSEGRVLAAAIQWISGQPYRPRYKPLVKAVAGVLRGQTRTLGGVVLRPEKGAFRLSREVAQTPSQPWDPTAKQMTWDSRWRVIAPSDEAKYWENIEVKALGEAIQDVNSWREQGLPRRTLMASPAVFAGENLVAAPLAGLKGGWHAHIVADFASYLASH